MYPLTSQIECLGPWREWGGRTATGSWAHTLTLNGISCWHCQRDPGRPRWPINLIQEGICHVINNLQGEKKIFHVTAESERRHRKHLHPWELQWCWPPQELLNYTVKPIPSGAFCSQLALEKLRGKCFRWTDSRDHWQVHFASLFSCCMCIRKWIWKFKWWQFWSRNGYWNGRITPQCWHGMNSDQREVRVGWCSLQLSKLKQAV